MKRRLFSFLIAILIFIINCVPVLATEFVSGNFNVIPDDFISDINLTIQEGHKYIYYFQARNNSWEGPNHHIIYFDFPLEVEGVISESRITLTNFENTDSVIYWTRSLSGLDGQFYSGKTMSVGESFNIGLGLVVVPELLIYNGDCVSKNYCSDDVFIEMGSGDDYEEDGVVIKGLTSFFNKMTSVLNEILNSISDIVDSIIGIPDEGYFVEKIESVKNSINEKYNLDILFGFFEDIKNTSSTSPNFSFDKDLTVNGITIPFDFYIDFSWFDGEIKNVIFLLFRAVGYPLLIIYNLNQVYLLFRGRKFFDMDGGEDS